MTNFPPIKDELRQAAKPRLDVSLKPRPELPDEAISATPFRVLPGLGEAS
jgi:hypothetical protein